MAWIVRLRDEENLSWRKISDQVEEYLARKAGQRPRSQGFRTGWTAKSCYRGYHSAKLLIAGLPQPTHRRCKDCRRSLPVARFEQTDEGLCNICRECQVTRPIRTLEARRQHVVRAILRLLRAALANHDAPKVIAVQQILVDAAGGTELAATDVALELLRQCKQNPSSRAALRGLETFFELLNFTDRLGNTSGKLAPAALSDAEIDREIHHLLRPAVSDLITEMELPAQR